MGGSISCGTLGLEKLPARPALKPLPPPQQAEVTADLGKRKPGILSRTPGSISGGRERKGHIVQLPVFRAERKRGKEKREEDGGKERGKEEKGKENNKELSG